MNTDIGYLMKVIQENLEKHRNHIFKPVELTSSQVRVLRFLRDRGREKTSQKDIERFLRVSHPTVVGILQRLEQKGFITTEFDGVDKRNKYVYLTQKEEELFLQMMNSIEEIENLLTRGLNEEEVQELRRLLLKVFENVKG